MHLFLLWHYDVTDTSNLIKLLNLNKAFRIKIIRIKCKHLFLLWHFDMINTSNVIKLLNVSESFSRGITNIECNSLIETVTLDLINVFSGIKLLTLSEIIYYRNNVLNLILAERYSFYFHYPTTVRYSLKINELNQSSQAGVFFFNSTPAKDTNFWVKLLLCVSSDLSYRYTIETRVHTAHIWFPDE